MNISSLRSNKDILATMLFGSTARKDADQYSDKDIFVLCRNVNAIELLNIRKNYLSEEIKDHNNFCFYRHKDVIRMAEKGSLFLWHLKLQGRMLFSKDNSLEKVLETLKPYNNYKEDLCFYGKLLDDVNESLNIWGRISEYDYSQLFTITRNICILLCYYKDEPKFGRTNAYIKAKRLFGKKLPLSEYVYTNLCAWKLWYERGIRPNKKLDNNKMDSLNIINHIEYLLKYAKALTYERITI